MKTSWAKTAELKKLERHLAKAMETKKAETKKAEAEAILTNPSVELMENHLNKSTPCVG
jgi:hypothetical protein